MEDIRIQRTKKNIAEAFLSLRAEKSIHKITVKELADRAMINKATFYHYYSDINDLAGKLQNQFVADILADIRHPQYLLTNPQEGIMEMIQAITSHSQMFDMLFDQSELAVFVEKYEVAIKELIFQTCPELKRSFEADLIITMLIQGNFLAFLNCKQKDSSRAIKLLGEINELILSKLPDPH